MNNKHYLDIRKYLMQKHLWCKKDMVESYIPGSECMKRLATTRSDIRCSQGLATEYINIILHTYTIANIFIV